MHSLEATMIDLVNRERQKHGLPFLKQSEGLRKVARLHSQDQSSKRKIFHESQRTGAPADRIKKHGIWYSKCGENVATSHSIGVSHKGLMNSTGHRANILSPHFDTIGIGIHRTVLRRLYITQLFTKDIVRVNLDQEGNKLLRSINAFRNQYGYSKLLFLNFQYLHVLIKSTTSFKEINLDRILADGKSLLSKSHFPFTFLHGGLQMYLNIQDVMEQQASAILNPNLTHIALTLRQDPLTGGLVFLFVLIGC